MCAKAKKKINRAVEEILDDLPRAELIIVKRLRSLILECLPFGREENDYGLPIYKRHKMICFIVAPSHHWSPKKYTLENKGVALGFWRGNLMSNGDGALLAEGRKQIYYIYFKKLSDIDDNQVRALIYEADMIDETLHKQKKK